MVSRTAHFRAQERHAQRPVGAAKPQLPARDTDTVWIGQFVAQLSTVEGYLTVDSSIVQQLGHTASDREIKLRELSRRGVLRMSVQRDGDRFIEYCWEVNC